MASAKSVSDERRPSKSESLEEPNPSGAQSEKTTTTDRTWPSDEGAEGDEEEMTDIFKPDIEGADDTVSFEGSGNRPPPSSPLSGKNPGSETAIASSTADGQAAVRRKNVTTFSTAGMSEPAHAAGGDGGENMDEVDDLAGRRPRTLGLRALAQVREMSTVWQRRTRSGSKALRRGGTATIAMQPAVEADAVALSEQDLAADKVTIEQRKELLCCFFLFCCGLLACKYLIIEQYKISRRREDATTKATVMVQAFPPEVVDPTINQAPIVPFPLICVYGDTLRPTTLMPYDSVCDYMFFDSFYKDGANKIGTNAVRSVSLETFLQVSERHTYTITQMGIGFSQYGASEALRILNTDEGDDFMLELWKSKNLRHYGILDIDARSTNVRDLLSLLQTLRYQQQLNLEDDTSSRKPTAYIIVGISFNVPREGDSYVALEMLFSQFPVDLLIARTHLDLPDDHRDDCRITGPTIYKHPYAAYQLSMVDVVQFLHEKRHSFARTTVAISVTMRARWYQPRDTDSHYYYQVWPPGYVYPYPGFQAGQPCSSLGDRDHFTSYFQVCSLGGHFSSRQQRIQGDKQFIHTFSESDGLVLTFDSNVTIQFKFCNLRQILNGVAYGIAVFDVDEDAWERNPCPYGPKNFERLNMVRKLVDHVSIPGNNHFPAGCWSIT